jgi:hypothetical protein
MKIVRPAHCRPQSFVAVVAALLALSGCSGPVAQVKGRVTCQDKPVPGVIRFSPVADEAQGAGRAVTAETNGDGAFELRLTSIGKYKVVVSPRDINYPPPPGGFDFPCSRSAQEHEVKAGMNVINFVMTPHTP